jgi:APA family basic amino acid/polyamine antiporter
MAATAQLQKPAGLVRAVRRWDLVALVINCIIGTGIFGLPSQAYALTGAYSLFAFIACALVVVTVAITYAEVAGRFPGTGGAYLYVSEAFGPLIGFEVGWVTYLARVSSIGFACNVLVNYLSYFWPAAGGGLARVAIMIGVMLVLTGVNIIGVGRAAVLSDIFTIGKLVPMALFIGVGLFFIHPQNYSFSHPPAPSSFSLAVAQLVFAFTGFELASIATGEAREPQRNIPFAILTAFAVVAVFYILIQVVCIGTLPGLGSSTKPLSDASRLFMGPTGASIITTGVMISAVGNLIGIVLAGSRLPFAMAEHQYLPRLLARIHPRFHTPHFAIVLTASIGLLLGITGTFTYTLSLTAISKLVTFIGVCSALPALRARGAASGFRAPAGTFLSVVAVLLCTWLLINSGWRGLRDVGIAAAAGLCIYLWYRMKAQRSAGTTALNG